MLVVGCAITLVSYDKVGMSLVDIPYLIETMKFWVFSFYSTRLYWVLSSKKREKDIVYLDVSD